MPLCKIWRNTCPNLLQGRQASAKRKVPHPVGAGVVEQEVQVTTLARQTLCRKCLTVDRWQYEGLGPCRRMRFERCESKFVWTRWDMVMAVVDTHATCILCFSDVCAKSIDCCSVRQTLYLCWFCAVQRPYFGPIFWLVWEHVFPSWTNLKHWIWVSSTVHA